MELQFLSPAPRGVVQPPICTFCFRYGHKDDGSCAGSFYIHNWHW